MNSKIKVDIIKTVKSNLPLVSDLKNAEYMVDSMYTACELIEKKQAVKRLKLKPSDYDNMIADVKTKLKNTDYRLRPKKQGVYSAESGKDTEPISNMLLYEWMWFEGLKKDYSIYLLLCLETQDAYVVKMDNAKITKGWLWKLCEKDQSPLAFLDEEQAQQLEKLCKKLAKTAYRYDFDIKYKGLSTEMPESAATDKQAEPEKPLHEVLANFLSCSNEPKTMLYLLGMCLLARQFSELPKGYRFAVSIVDKEPKGLNGFLEMLCHISSKESRVKYFYPAKTDPIEKMKDTCHDKLFYLDCTKNCSKTDLKKLAETLDKKIGKLDVGLLIVSKSELASELVFPVALGNLDKKQIALLKTQTAVLRKSAKDFWKSLHDTDITTLLKEEYKLIQKDGSLSTKQQKQTAALCMAVKQYLASVTAQGYLTQEQCDMYLQQLPGYPSEKTGQPEKTPEVTGDIPIDAAALSDALARNLGTIYQREKEQIATVASNEEPFAYTGCSKLKDETLLCFANEQAIQAFLEAHSDSVEAETAAAFAACDWQAIKEQCRDKAYLYCPDKGKFTYKMKKGRCLSFRIANCILAQGTAGTEGTDPQSEE